MVAKYRHGGSSAALGRPAIAYAEGRCVGGSTEINSGLYHRLPAELAERVAAHVRHRRVRARARSTATRRRSSASSPCRALPGAPPVSSAVLERGATKLGWRSVEFSRVFRYEHNGRAVKQTMARTFLPRAIDAGAEVVADCRVTRLRRSARSDRGRRVRAAATRRDDRAPHDPAPTTSSCARARSRRRRCCSAAGSARNIGTGLKLHPTVKIAARFPHPIDHGDVPMHRVTEFAPEPHDRRLGQPARSRRPRARRLVRRLRRRARQLGARRRLLRRHPQRGLRPRARAARVCGRRS